MTDHKAFLNAILQNPDDPNQRIVYADWLEEKAGDAARAEEIRGNVEPVAKPLAVVWNYEMPRAGNGELLTGRQADEAREILYRNGFDERKWEAKKLSDGMVRYSQEKHFQATYRLGFIERIQGSVADWQRVGWWLLREHPIRDIVFSDMEERRIVGGNVTLSFANDHNLPRRIIKSCPRLHLRKQQDGSWAAHWLRMEDAEPPDIMPRPGVLDFEIPINRSTGEYWAYALWKGNPFKEFASREAMLDGLPRFLEECLKRQSRVITGYDPTTRTASTS